MFYQIRLGCVVACLVVVLSGWPSKLSADDKGRGKVERKNAAAKTAEKKAPAATAGELRTCATRESIGIEWDLLGDANHDAVGRVRYREVGAEDWRDGLPLFRVDFRGYYAGLKAERAFNMLAGSLLYLSPGTQYEIELELSDPDGGDNRQTAKIATRAVTKRPESARILHVNPSGARGNGSLERPFGSVIAAQNAAKPGDVLFLEPGSYGSLRVEKPGTEEAPIHWISAEEGEALFDNVEIAASFVHLEGFRFERARSRAAIQAAGRSHNVTLARNQITGYTNGIVLNSLSSNWRIADNLIEGDAEQEATSTGIDLGRSGGHIVEHNSIFHVTDGICYPRENCDILGNDLADLTGDGIKPDYGYANVRILGNRLTNIGDSAITFQPMNSGPWYIVRNQVVGARQSLKMRVQDRFLLAHNTFLGWGTQGDRMHYLMSAMSRNNLFLSTGIATGEAPFWGTTDCRQSRFCLPDRYQPSWATDLDYNGFAWGEHQQPFSWDGGKTQHADLASFAAAVGIEKHSRLVQIPGLFAEFEVPSDVQEGIDPPLLRLAEGSAAIDAGSPLPNVSARFHGAAPDLGCHELGEPAPEYGVRARSASAQ